MRNTGPEALLAGRYRALGRIGTGGMAEVLLGRMSGPFGFERPVVIKRILPHFASEERFRTMFLDEARTVAKISHPNVVQVFDLGHEDESLFLVMEYLEGESLSSVLKRLVARKRRLEYAVYAHVIAEACAGLAAAHALKDASGTPRPVIHRDISPSNIFLTYDGSVKVIDFGIALDADRQSQTEPGHIKGKCAYMSPEQVRGKRLDPRSDVFAMGVVLYELTCGRRLFKRKTQTETLLSLLNDPVVPPSRLLSDYPKQLEAVCLKSLSRNPAGRYANANEMRSALMDCVLNLAERDPGQQLKAVLHGLFSERVEEKRKMLAHVAEGASLTHIPKGEVNESQELPTVERPSSPGMDGMYGPDLSEPLAPLAETGSYALPSLGSIERPALGPMDEVSKFGPSPATGAGYFSESVSVERGDFAEPTSTNASGLAVPDGVRFRWFVLVLAAFGVLIGMVVTLLAVVWERPLQTQPPQPAPKTVAVPVEPPALPAPTKVTFTIHSRPEGASVLIEGARRGRTPLTVQLKRDRRPRQLRLEREGFAPLAVELSPDRDRELWLALEAVPKKAPKPAPRKRAKPREKLEPYRAFDSWSE